MNFRIADTFTDSLAKLAGEEQEAVKTNKTIASACKRTQRIFASNTLKNYK